MKLILWPRIWSVLVNVLCVLEKNVDLLFWVVCSVGANWVKLVTCILHSVSYCETNLEIFICNCGSVCFSFQFYLVLLHVFWNSVTSRETCKVVISSWYIDSFVIKEYPSSSWQCSLLKSMLIKKVWIWWLQLSFD